MKTIVMIILRKFRIFHKKNKEWDHFGLVAYRKWLINKRIIIYTDTLPDIKIPT